MKKLVDEIRKAEELLGEYKKKPNKTEEKNINSMRRSISINKNRKKGEKINLQDLIWVRSAKGLRPGNEKKILKKAKKNYSSGDLLL